MTLGKRLLQLARANLNALFDRHGADLEEFTDEELSGELRQREARKRREEEARRTRVEAERVAARRARERGAQDGGARAASGGGSSAKARSGASATHDAQGLSRHYAELETPAGSDLATVKHNFRRLMRVHHPDLHADSPERHRAATERAKRLTVAYSALEAALGEARG